MKIDLLIFALWLTLVNVSASSKFPSSFQKCDRKQEDFDRCLISAAQNAIEQMNKEFPEIEFPNIEPLNFGDITAPPGLDTGLFTQDFKNFSISGHTNVTVNEFNVNFETKAVKMLCFFPRLTIKFEHYFHGKILAVPFHGGGPGKATCDNVTYDLTFNLEEYTKEDKNYYKIENTTLVMDMGLATFDLPGLNQKSDLLGLTDRVNIGSVFNQNWRRLFLELKENYEVIFARTYSNIFNNLLKNVPISEVFGAP